MKKPPVKEDKDALKLCGDCKHHTKATSVCVMHPGRIGEGQKACADFKK